MDGLIECDGCLPGPNSDPATIPISQGSRGGTQGGMLGDSVRNTKQQVSIYFGNASRRAKAVILPNRMLKRAVCLCSNHLNLTGEGGQEEGELKATKLRLSTPVALTHSDLVTKAQKAIGGGRLDAV